MLANIPCKLVLRHLHPLCDTQAVWCKGGQEVPEPRTRDRAANAQVAPIARAVPKGGQVAAASALAAATRANCSDLECFCKVCTRALYWGSSLGVCRSYRHCQILEYCASMALSITLHAVLWLLPRIVEE